MIFCTAKDCRFFDKCPMVTLDWIKAEITGCSAYQKSK